MRLRKRMPSTAVAMTITSKRKFVCAEPLRASSSTALFCSATAPILALPPSCSNALCFAFRDAATSLIAASRVSWAALSVVRMVRTFAMCSLTTAGSNCCVLSTQAWAICRYAEMFWASLSTLVSMVMSSPRSFSPSWSKLSTWSASSLVNLSMASVCEAWSMKRYSWARSASHAPASLPSTSEASSPMAAVSKFSTFTCCKFTSMLELLPVQPEKPIKHSLPSLGIVPGGRVMMSNQTLLVRICSP
mmetsp:Transcript_24554/g.56987  ORF Transcript_24554/g.56987 Transcript_24554/m.56987 type:complete len:247 (-) Transcript_24554:376-1116(-)